jgi:LysR family transcriptional activator of nhaA
MERLNYQHLLYFRVIARKGNMKRLCEELNLFQPALRAQLRVLEDTLGETLFTRVERPLVLTEVGRMAYQSLKIFSLAQKFTNVIKDRPSLHPGRVE